MGKKNKEISFDESGDCSTEIQEQFQKSIDAFEQAKWCQPFQVLVASGISLPPSGELSEPELNAKLWEVIKALALMGVYLEHTDHLNDRELYILLLDDILLEEMAFQSGEMNLACHIDLIGSGSDEDNYIYLKYYADEDDRTLWIKEFPDESIPGRERLPFDRDCRLPKPDPGENFDVH
ncbi:MAG: hypothetical protein Q7J23_05540 [Nitrosomonas sp.]|jgi:hypothetical protein|uniref:hypothetical protein n=2 Tax=Nitrosomonas sp. TaxID=42353 RepID=UPI00271BAA9B|nr:hypothetical protein [Nitrosomonas sp.]MDO8895005.1 hypothetical protein [Nitrosomonas sp.]MDO9470171.1 hypothetical protein [Nitrosomonas sp.]MDP2224826.1 hypothetical protein [Nitrosomonas sp.]